MPNFSILCSSSQFGYKIDQNTKSQINQSMPYWDKWLGYSSHFRQQKSKWSAVHIQTSMDSYYQTFSYFLIVEKTKRKTSKRGILASVTRIGKISQLWHTVETLWPFLKGASIIWHNFELNLANFICYCANFHCCKWQNIDKHSSHLVPLIQTIYHQNNVFS